jgi:hypothetical protein
MARRDSNPVVNVESKLAVASGDLPGNWVLEKTPPEQFNSIGGQMGANIHVFPLNGRSSKNRAGETPCPAFSFARGLQNFWERSSLKRFSNCLDNLFDVDVTGNKVADE